MKVVVVGAGIVGCSVAHALVARGLAVTLVDADEPASGTTATSYGWINSHKKHPLPYHELNLRGVDYWATQVASRYPGTVEMGGHIEIANTVEHRDSLASRVSRLGSLGYLAEWIDVPKARALTPIAVSDGAAAARFPTEGHADPVAFCRAVLAELTTSHLFEFRRGRVVGIDSAAPSVTLEDGLVLKTDAVVLCAGTATAALAELAGSSLPLVPENVDGPAFGYLADVDVIDHGLACLVTTDELGLRPHGPHRLIAQVLDLDATADPAVEPPAALTSAIRARVAAVLPGATVGTISVRVGHRVIPADGLTAAGPLVGAAWAIATHSGVVLGPWLGTVIAAEIDGGRPDPLLDKFRPERFATPTGATTPIAAAPRRPGDQ